MRLKTTATLVSALAVFAACSPGGAPADTAYTPDAAQPAAEEEVLPVAAGTYVIDPNHKSFVFRLSHLGLGDYVLRFRDFDVSVVLDPADIANSSVTASIEAASIASDFPGDYVGTHQGSPYASWEEDLAQRPRFLNAGEFPQITYASTSVEQTGPRTAKVTGDLTFLGVTRPVALDVTLTGATDSHPFAQQPAVGLSAMGSFNRSDFGMTYLVDAGAAGDAITVQIDGDFIAQAAD